MSDETTQLSDETTAPVAAAAPESTSEPTAEATPKDAKPAAEEKKTDDSRNRRGGGGRGRRDRKPREPKEFEESIIQIDRVTRVTKGGRQLRFRVSVVIGDQKGRVGFGIGKSAEVMSGVQKAITAAKLNLVTVPIFEDTIPHAVSYKFKASKVFLLPAQEGKGVIAGGAVRKVLELSGIKNVLSKMHGSRNKLNSVYATMECLKALQNRAPISNKEPDSAEATTDEAVEAPKAETKAKKPVAKKAPAADKPAKKAPAKKKES